MYSKWAAVIGSPVEHSLSPVLHKAGWASLGIGAGWDYLKIEQTRESAIDFVRSLGDKCLGLSVTMPCKQAIIPILDGLDPIAKAVNSVNTVIPSEGMLRGFNTDVHGIIDAIQEKISTAPRVGKFLNGEISSAIIIGSGATASSALAAVNLLKVPNISCAARHFEGPNNITMTARRLATNLSQIPLDDEKIFRQRIDSADIVISTIPAYAQEKFVTLIKPRSDQILLDVVYAPRETPLKQVWRSYAAPIVPATSMLLHQAKMQVRLMTHETPSVESMRRALYAALSG